MAPMKNGPDISVLRPPRGGHALGRPEPRRERRVEQDVTPENELRRPVRIDRGYPERAVGARFKFTPFWIGAASLASGLLVWWLFDRKKKTS